MRNPQWWAVNSFLLPPASQAMGSEGRSVPQNQTRLPLTQECRSRKRHEGGVQFHSCHSHLSSTSRAWLGPYSTAQAVLADTELWPWALRELQSRAYWWQLRGHRTEKACWIWRVAKGHGGGPCRFRLLQARSPMGQEEDLEKQETNPGWTSGEAHALATLDRHLHEAHSAVESSAL